MNIHMYQNQNNYLVYISEGAKLVDNFETNKKAVQALNKVKLFVSKVL